MLGIFSLFLFIFGIVGSILVINKHENRKFVLIIFPALIFLVYLEGYYGRYVINIGLSFLACGVLIGSCIAFITKHTANQNINSQSYQTNNSVKFCSNCGAEVYPNAVICVKCGCAIKSRTDVPSTGLNIISFLLPIVGLILYIVYHQDSPRKASEIGKWALISFCINIVVIIITFAS